MCPSQAESEKYLNGNKLFFYIIFFKYNLKLCLKTDYFQKQGDFSSNKETRRLPPKQGVSMPKRDG